MDRRVTFQRKQGARDAFNAEVETWYDLGTVWAARMDISDGERWRAAEVAAEITTRFRVRVGVLTRSITPADRIRTEGRDYDIQGIKEIAREGFEITANARADLIDAAS